jgi:NAD(P)-dependent dehydrogenase (short-subunit alcohol dehydrogenase family)
MTCALSAAERGFGFMQSTVKTVIVTGANSGIGRATVELFAERGWNVIATMRRMELAAMFDDRPNVSVMELDVAEQASIDAFSHQVLATGKCIDVLVNNAGYLQLGALEATSMAQVREQFETNVFGLIGMTKAFLPHFRENGAGMVINVSSISAENGYPFASVYSASKAAVATLTESLNIELNAVGASAKAVLPGMHATRIFDCFVPSAQTPAAYKALFTRFNDILGSLKGSEPSVAANAIFKAATDGAASNTRYFCGPDATLVPHMKRLMGAAGYWKFFRNTMLNGPSALVRRLSPQGRVIMNVNVEPGMRNAAAQRAARIAAPELPNFRDPVKVSRPGRVPVPAPLVPSANDARDAG